MGHYAEADAVLTRRQAEILALVARDMTDKQIAEHLYLSTNTVTSHVKSARKTLGVKTRAGAVATLFRRGDLS